MKRNRFIFVYIINRRIMEKEIWADIKGYEGLYQVSTYGRVRSLNYKRTGKIKIMKCCFCNGYFNIGLTKNKKTKTFLIHRLVAEAFISNQDNLPEINHIDENRSNNHVENLEYCDHNYNINYGTRTKKMVETRIKGEKSETIVQLNRHGNLIREWSSAMEIERELGFKHTNIYTCCLGKRKSANGFVWKYKKDVV